MVTSAERDKLEAEQLEDRVIRIDRTRKTVAGGRLSSARVVVAVGDNKGNVGLGVGKARNVPEAIAKGIRKAKKNMLDVPLDGYTIPHVSQAKVGGAIILLKPASRGTGIIAGGAVRQLIEVSGIRDVLTKSLGSGNVMNRAKACFKALQKLRDPNDVAKQLGKSVEELMGREIVNAYAEAEKREAQEAAEEVAEEAQPEAGEEMKKEAEEAPEEAEAASEEIAELEEAEEQPAVEEPAEESEKQQPTEEPAIVAEELEDEELPDE